MLVLLEAAVSGTDCPVQNRSQALAVSSGPDRRSASIVPSSRRRECNRCRDRPPVISDRRSNRLRAVAIPRRWSNRAVA